MNSFFARKFVIQGIFLAVAIILLARIFYIQVIDDKYLLSAQNNVIRKLIIYPARGVITDRNGKVLVQNEPVYDLLVVPREVKPFDTIAFCQLIGIDKARFDKQFKKAKTYSPYKSSIFEKQLSAVTYAAFQERLFEFPGFFVSNRTVRRYPDSTAAQFLGFIGEVSDKVIESSNGYYRQGDYIGISGVEKAYEDILRGRRGVRNIMVDVHNREKGSFAEGAYDTVAVAGEKLISSLDIRIQKLGEQLLQNKVGSIVAIEPSTGEILAFVSSPNYDPNLMVGRERGNNVAKMYRNPYNPFLIRPIQAYYSPGSSFKPIDGLIALQEGIITDQTQFFCPHYYMAGNHRVNCEHFDGSTNLERGIAMSCNTYFCYVFDHLIRKTGHSSTREAYLNWKKHVNNFGLGTKLGIDLPNEKKGLIPEPERYDKIFGLNRWRSSTIISLAIGQGEMLATPLQMANLEAIIANRGFYYKPHLIKAIGDKKVVKKEYTIKNYVGVDEKHFEPVINGMQQVVENGTATASRIPGVVMVGKTGTVQNPRGKNHSVFVGYAPRDNPKIAIAVVVENAGYGSSWAAPIASFVMEKYLKDSITRRPSGIDPKRYMDAYMLPPVRLRGEALRLYKADSVKAAKADSVKKVKIDSLKKLQIKKANLLKPVNTKILAVRRKDD